jgi:hypothetical protein
MTEKQWIRKVDYVPQKGDKIIDPMYYSFNTGFTYVIVEREQTIPEPCGDVIVKYNSNLRSRPTLAKRDSSSGLWFNYTNRDGYENGGERNWADFVARNGITSIHSIYRKEI